MASAETIARMKAIIAKQLEVDEARVTEDASFQKDLDADSLDLVEMIMSIEEEFDVTIPDKDAEKILTVRDALNYLDAHQEG
jgi:acyl carrier protein